MTFDYERVCSEWDPWAAMPRKYNLGVALTRGQVDTGHGSKMAIVWENADGAARSITYAQLDVLSNRLASSLGRLGVHRGDRVFLRLPNIPEFYIAALAVAKLGAVFIPSSTQFRAGEVEYRLRDSGAVAAITTTGLVEAIDCASGTCPALQHVIVLRYPEPDRLCREHIDLGHLIADGSETFTPAPTQSDDVAFIAYTSGTTGDPKGVVHLQRYPIAYGSLVRYWHDYRPSDVVACPAQLGWLLPVASTFLYALANGVTIVLYDMLRNKFDPVRWFGLIEKYGITNFVATPTVCRLMVAEAGAVARYDLSRWRHAVTAGEPLPADTYRAFLSHFGIAPLDGIGMSECMVYCFNMIGMPVQPGSCGRPGPGSVIEVMGDDLKPVRPDTEGILCLRRDSHPGMMKEYWDKPEQTAEIFRGQWYYSGDVVVRDSEGHFWFKGRNDDVMNASGYRVSPFEVENCLVEHPAVMEAAAVESPDPIRGTVVKAFLVLRPEFHASEALAAEIQQFVKHSIASYKYPRKIEFVDALPKTTSGKVKRRELRTMERRCPEKAK